MTAFTTWVRRGSGLWLFLTVVLGEGLVLLPERPWSLDYDWGVRHGASLVYVVAPLVAAAVAFDIAA